jgi:hypothetical protein
MEIPRKNAKRFPFTQKPALIAKTNTYQLLGSLPMNFLKCLAFLSLLTNPLFAEEASQKVAVELLKKTGIKKPVAEKKQRGLLFGEALKKTDKELADDKARKNDRYYGMKGLIFDDFFVVIGAGYGLRSLSLIRGPSYGDKADGAAQYYLIEFESREVGWSFLPFVENFKTDVAQTTSLGLQATNFVYKDSGFFRVKLGARKWKGGDNLRFLDSTSSTAGLGLQKMNDQTTPLVQLEAGINYISPLKSTRKKWGRWRGLVRLMMGYSPGVKYTRTDTNGNNSKEVKEAVTETGIFFGIGYII